MFQCFSGICDMKRDVKHSKTEKMAAIICIGTRLKSKQERISSHEEK